MTILYKYAEDIRDREPFDNIINFWNRKKMFWYIYVFCDSFFFCCKTKFSCIVFESFILCYEVLLILNDRKILWKIILAQNEMCYLNRPD